MIREILRKPPRFVGAANGQQTLGGTVTSAPRRAGNRAQCGRTAARASVATVAPACHAGGRRFESGRSR